MIQILFKGNIIFPISNIINRVPFVEITLIHEIDQQSVLINSFM